MSTTTKKKVKKQSAPVDDDERFAEIKKDPRFLEMQKSKKKVKIDKKRFNKVFDKEFNTIGKFDKTGKRVNIKDKTMQGFYEQASDKDSDDEDGSESEDEQAVESKANKFYDEDGNFQWKNDEESSSSSGSDDEEEGEQEQSEEEMERLWDENDGIPYEETVKEDLGNRLALNKMDWDVMTAVDILAIFNSLCQGDRIVKKVEIYPSLYGIEQMKKDALLGPP